MSQVRSNRGLERRVHPIRREAALTGQTSVWQMRCQMTLTTGRSPLCADPAGDLHCRRRLAAPDVRRVPRRQATSRMALLAILLLVATGAWSSDQPAGRDAVSMAPSSSIASRRFMKVLMLIGSALAILLSLDFLREHEHSRKFEYPVLVLLSHARHDADDLGQRPDRALSRPRAAEPGALRARRRSTATICARPRPA